MFRVSEGLAVIGLRVSEGLGVIGFRVIVFWGLGFKALGLPLLNIGTALC